MLNQLTSTKKICLVGFGEVFTTWNQTNFIKGASLFFCLHSIINYHYVLSGDVDLELIERREVLIERLEVVVIAADWKHGDGDQHATTPPQGVVFVPPCADRRPSLS